MIRQITEKINAMGHTVYVVDGTEFGSKEHAESSVRFLDVLDHRRESTTRLYNKLTGRGFRVCMKSEYTWRIETGDAWTEIDVEARNDGKIAEYQMTGNRGFIADPDLLCFEEVVANSNGYL